MKPTSDQRALPLLGDRWSMWLLVTLDAAQGSRFSDLAAAAGLSRRVLADRLRRLQEAELVRAERYSARPPRQHYLLSERGQRAQRLCVEMLHAASGTVAAARAASPGTGAHPTDALLEADLASAQAIYEATVAALVRYDDQYRTPLVETLSTYLSCDASVSVTAARMYAHRHTIRYRLSRVTELTGLDVDALADRERLMLGLRALRLFEQRGDELT